MPGRNSADNKFGVSPFIVGQVLGDGCNYAGGLGLQQAIDDAFAVGGSVVCIRPATTPYVVNLTLREGVDLKAWHTDGRLPVGLDNVSIQGTHTWAPTGGGFLQVVCDSIEFDDPTFGDLFTFSPTVGTFAIFAIKYSSGTSNSGAGGGRTFVLNPDGTSAMIVALNQVNIDAGQVAIDCVGTGQSQIQVGADSNVSSAMDSCIRFSSGTCACVIQWSQVQGGTIGIEDMTGTGSIFAQHANIFANTSCVSFTVAGGNFVSQHNTLTANAVNYIAGTGTFTHADTVLPSSTTLPVTVTEVKTNWQPYCSAGNSVTAYRGTAGFDSTQFTVTDGFVQFTGTPASMTWVDQALSTTVVANQGNFATAAVNLTLPAGAAQGDVCEFKAVSPSQMIVLANAGQTLEIGNQAGTSAANTQQGDALELTFRFATSTWWGNASIGNFNVT